MFPIIPAILSVLRPDTEFELLKLGLQTKLNNSGRGVLFVAAQSSGGPALRSLATSRLIQYEDAICAIQYIYNRSILFGIQTGIW